MPTDVSSVGCGSMHSVPRTPRVTPLSLDQRSVRDGCFDVADVQFVLGHLLGSVFGHVVG